MALKDTIRINQYGASVIDLTVLGQDGVNAFYEAIETMVKTASVDLSECDTPESKLTAIKEAAKRIYKVERDRLPDDIIVVNKTRLKLLDTLMYWLADKYSIHAR